MKVKQTKITVKDLADGYIDKDYDGVFGYGGKLDIRPPIQRGFVYNENQQEEVIRTASQEFPLNSMYWAVRDDGSFEVIDGQQRTISLCKFVKNNFSVAGLFGFEEPRFFHNLTDEERKIILDYPLTVYQCEGTHSEKIKWFQVINIAGEKLNKQEILNAVYCGIWVGHAKRWFSGRNPQARRHSDYLSGNSLRQDYLETAIRWAAMVDGCGIEEYMAKHQNDESADPLWDYFESVIDWVKKIFPKYRKPMEKVDWGKLYLAHHNKTLDADALESEVAKYMRYEEIRKKSGIYEYLLTGEKSCLDLRAFEESDKIAAYENQGGICGKGSNDGCGNHFEMKEMHADHIIPWNKGGRTRFDNLQMLCADCNLRKSDN